MTERKTFTLRYTSEQEKQIDKLRETISGVSQNDAILKAINIYINDYQKVKNENSVLSANLHKAQNELKELKDLIRQRKSIVKKINKIINKNH